MKTKRGKIRLTSFVLAVVVALSISTISETYKRLQYERIISISQQSALSELSRYIDNIERSLTKGMYASTSPMLSSIAATLWRDATGAKTSLAHLSSGDTPLENTYKFLSQVGEFTMALNRKVADGQKITEEEKAQLKQLLGYATNLGQQLEYLQILVENDNLDFERIKSTLNTQAQKNENVNFLDSISDAEQTLTDYPTLLYDGPFADNIEQKESAMLKQYEVITVEKAKELAAKYTGLEPGVLARDEDEDGKMPSYVFSSNERTVSITKNGGFLSYLLSGTFAGVAQLSQEDAVKKARDYLNNAGYIDMKESYFSTIDGVCLVNFAYCKNDIIYYPDLIVVGVALDTGRVVSVDARGYIMNHYDRSLPDIGFSIELGKNNISSDLIIKNAAMAVIPKDNGGERFVYEYHCVDAGEQEVLIYIDAKSGDEADILLLMYTDGGVLTK